LPRGGVALGVVVARALGAPLDLLITRKIGHPMAPEYAVCAISDAGGLICNEDERAQLDPTWLGVAIARERAEAARRRVAYLRDHPPVPVAGKTALIVDDGIATGLTMRAAINEVRLRHPARVVVGVPVIPSDTAVVLRREADAVVALEIPSVFLGSVGAYYEDFGQLTDGDVMRLLHEGGA
jgi:predicted phosphoribosyltransferase